MDKKYRNILVTSLSMPGGILMGGVLIDELFQESTREPAHTKY